MAKFVLHADLEGLSADSFTVAEIIISTMLDTVDIEARMAKIMTIMPQICVKSALNEQQFIAQYKEKKFD